HERVGDVDRNEIGCRSAPGQKRKTARIDDMGRPPPHRSANAAVLQSGENQERPEQSGNEHRHDGESLQIEMHGAHCPRLMRHTRRQAFHTGYYVGNGSRTHLPAGKPQWRNLTDPEPYLAGFGATVPAPRRSFTWPPLPP